MMKQKKTRNNNKYKQKKHQNTNAQPIIEPINEEEKKANDRKVIEWYQT